MIPVGAGLVLDGEVVQVGVAWADWALCQHWRAVHLDVALHKQTVDMQGGVCVGEAVGQVDLDPIALLDPDVGPRVLAVAGDDVSLGEVVDTVFAPAGSPIESMGSRMDARAEQQQQKGNHEAISGA